MAYSIRITTSFSSFALPCLDLTCILRLRMVLHVVVVVFDDAFSLMVFIVFPYFSIICWFYTQLHHWEMRISATKLKPNQLFSNKLEFASEFDYDLYCTKCDLCVARCQWHSKRLQYYEFNKLHFVLHSAFCRLHVHWHLCRIQRRKTGKKMLNALACRSLSITHSLARSFLNVVVVFFRSRILESYLS